MISDLFKLSNLQNPVLRFDEGHHALARKRAGRKVKKPSQLQQVMVEELIKILLFTFNNELS